MSLLHFLCSIIIIVLILWGLKYILNYNKSAVEEQKEFIITGQELTIPTKSELQKLKMNYQEISSYFADIETLKQEITSLHNDVENALVCSDANRHFNSLAEYYATYQQKIDEVKALISSYTEKYDTYLDAILKIPQFSSEHDEKYEEFTSEFEADYKKAQKKLQDLEAIETLYLEAEQFADDWFEKDYDLMCRIVTQEAGICGTMERCYVANVLENRIKSSRYPDDPNYPNNLYGVVYDPGQYEPVMKGTIDNPPYESVKKDMEEYLRGRIETGMPENVLYQALFPQGRGTWQHMPSGHYFCY